MVPVGVVFPADVVEVGSVGQLALLRNLGIFENDAERSLANPAAIIEVVELDLDQVLAGLEQLFRDRVSVSRAQPSPCVGARTNHRP